MIVAPAVAVDQELPEPVADFSSPSSIVGTVTVPSTVKLEDGDIQVALASARELPRTLGAESREVIVANRSRENAEFSGIVNVGQLAEEDADLAVEDSVPLVAKTDVRSDGTFELTGLRPGVYKLIVTSKVFDYAPVWYRDAVDFRTATELNLQPGVLVPGIDVVFGPEVQKQSSSAGSRVDEKPDPDLAAQKRDQERFEKAVEQLRAEIAQSDDDAARLQALTEVSSNGTGSVSGKITLPAALEFGPYDVSVVLLKWDPFYEDFRTYRSFYLDPGSDGSYSFPNLEAGQYTIKVVAREANLVETWYEDSPESSDAEEFTLSDGQVLTGMNISPAIGATISGTVTVPAGVKYVDTDMMVFAVPEGRDMWDYVSATVVRSENGVCRYVLDRLPAGEYRLHIDAFEMNVMSQWYSGTTDVESAKTITVDAGQVFSAANFKMVAGGSITGTVTLPPGVDISDGAVFVSARSADPWGSDASRTEVVSDNGILTYTLNRLETGEYKIFFQPAGLRLMSQWYESANSFETAQSVSVEIGKLTKGIDAALIRGSSISGEVKIPDGVEVGEDHIWVSAFEVGDPDDFSSVGAFVTKEGGVYRYRIDGLLPGDYQLLFEPMSGTGLADTWYPDSVSRDGATIVKVALNQDLTGINASMIKAASISGKVTLAEGRKCPIYSGKESNCITVSAFDADGVVRGSTSVTSDAEYLLDQLVPGTYRVQFEAEDTTGVLGEWWEDQPTFSRAKPIALAGGESRTGVNAQLTLGASITGRFSLPEGIEGSEGAVWVDIYDSLTLQHVAWDWVDDGSDTFGFLALKPGSYKIHLGSDGLPILNQWYPHGSSPSDASEITVSAGDNVTLTEINFEKAGTIVGTVSAPGGMSVDRIEVIAYAADGKMSAWGTTSQDGKYQLTGLPSGSYKVRVTPRMPLNLLPVWYGGASSWKAASPIAVTAGGVVSNVDVALSKGGSVSGTVELPTGVDLSDGYVEVQAYDADGQMLRSASADDQGHYEIQGLPAGPVRLFLMADLGGAASQWYSNGLSFGRATPVDVRLGSTLTADFKLGATGTITGKITDPAKVGGLEKVRICATPMDTLSELPIPAEMRCTGSDPAGNYEVRGLSPGQYQVVFGSSYMGSIGFAQQWFSGKDTQNLADPVWVSAGKATIVNVAMAKEATIAGTLTVPDSVDLRGQADVYVTAYDSTNRQVAATPVNPFTGNYVIGGLAAGSYTIQAAPPFNMGFAAASSTMPTNQAVMNLVPAWFGGAKPTVITVKAGQAALGKNIKMVEGAAVSGSVGLAPDVSFDLVSSLDTFALVRVFDAADSSAPIREWFAPLGEWYHLSGLPADRDLKFEFSALDRMTTKRQWFSKQPTFAKATPVKLTANKVRTGISATLSAPGNSPDRNDPVVTRVSGSSRYLTNFAVNRQTLSLGAPLFVATGASFADALSVAPAVRALNGSLMLTAKTKVDADSLALLKVRKPSAIYVIGGEGAVSKNVVSQLKATTGVTPERVSGASRYATSEAILKKFFAARDIGGVFVATGRAFPDALSASAAGGALDMPVLLVDGKKAVSLEQSTLEFLGDKTRNLQLVGGTGAVNQTLERYLSARKFDVGRLSGANRFATGMAVNDYVSSEVPAEQVTGIWLATGMNFPDALSASVPAGEPSQRLVLSRKNCIPAPVVSQLITAPSSAVKTVKLVGGANAMSSAVFGLTECK